MTSIVFVAVGALVAGAVGILANWVPKPPWARRHPVLLLVILLFLVVVGTGAAWLAENPSEPDLAFTSPGDGDFVSESFEVNGVASGLDDEEDLWLFVVGGNNDVPGLVYYPYQETPLRIVDERWNVRITSLGEPEDELGSTYTLILVRANADCSRAIAERAPTVNGEIFFQKPLPQGCVQAPDDLNVRKGQ